MSLTDHAKREAALAYSHEILLRVAELFDLPRAHDHANIISDILYDHRQRRPDLAVELAREWADETMDGWRHQFADLEGTEGTAHVLHAQPTPPPTDDPPGGLLRVASLEQGGPAYPLARPAHLLHTVDVERGNL